MKAYLIIRDLGRLGFLAALIVICAIGAVFETIFGEGK